jgi:hypothetical protein
MIPEIIADRMEDQYEQYLSFLETHTKRKNKKKEYKPLSREEIREIMERRADIFIPVTSGIIDNRDRKKKDVAYVLSHKIIKELDKEFQDEIFDKVKKFDKMTKVEWGYIIVTLFICSILLLSYIEEEIGIQFITNQSGEITMKLWPFAKGFVSVWGALAVAWGLGFGFGKRWKYFD